MNYQHIFHDFAERETSQHIMNGIVICRDFFSEVNNKLHFLKRVVKEALTAYSVYAQALRGFSESMEFVEDGVMREYGLATYDSVFK